MSHRPPCVINISSKNSISLPETWHFSLDRSNDVLLHDWFDNLPQELDFIWVEITHTHYGFGSALFEKFVKVRTKRVALIIWSVSISSSIEVGNFFIASQRNFRKYSQSRGRVLSIEAVHLGEQNRVVRWMFRTRSISETTAWLPNDYCSSTEIQSIWNYCIYLNNFSWPLV